MVVVRLHTRSNLTTTMVQKLLMNGFVQRVRNYAWTHTEEDIGLVIDFRLKQYLPVESSGVLSNEDPGYRNMNLDVELSSEITALDTPRSMG